MMVIDYRKANYEILKHELNSLHREWLDKVPVELREGFLTNLVDENSNSYVKVYIEKWNDRDRKALFEHVMRGIYYYSRKISKNTVFPFSDYNSLRDAMNGATSFIMVYEKGMKWLDPYILNKIEIEATIK